MTTNRVNAHLNLPAQYYQVLEMTTQQVYEPPYDHHDTGGWRTVDTTDIHTFAELELLQKWLNERVTARSPKNFDNLVIQCVTKMVAAVTTIVDVGVKLP